MPGPIDLVVPNMGEFHLRHQRVGLGPRNIGDYLDSGTFPAD